MQITKPSFQRKKLLLTSSLLLVSILAGVVVYAVVNSEESSTQDTNVVKQNQTDTEPTNTVPAENNSGEPTPPEDKLPVQNEPAEEPESSGTLSARITSAHSFDGTLQVRTMIETITNTATCKLTLTKGDQEYTASADSQALAKSSTCKGFDIPVSDLSPGTWNLTIDIEDQGAKVRLSQNVTI